MSELKSCVCSSNNLELPTKTTGDINPEIVQNTNTNCSQAEEPLKDCDLLQDLLRDNYCYVCEASLVHSSQRISHYEGRKHAQRVKIYLNKKQPQENAGLLTCMSTEKTCKLCDMVFSSPTVAESHYHGKTHAKNLRKNNPPVARELAATEAPAVPNQRTQEKSDGQTVDFSDPNKFCRLCNAVFSKPLVAKQHYDGRKHQRNQARQDRMDNLGKCSKDKASAQSQKKGNRCSIEKKKDDQLCKSQKKLYDSFQDELDDYIQAQKARGLEPKAGNTSNAHRSVIEALPLKHSEVEHFPIFHTPIHSRVSQFGFSVSEPYFPAENTHVRPPFTQTLQGNRESPSSLSDTGSNTSSNSSSSSNSESRDWMRPKRKMTKRHEEGEGAVKMKRESREKGDEEDRYKKRKERRKRERSSGEDGSKRRAKKKCKVNENETRRAEEKPLDVQMLEAQKEPQERKEELVVDRTEAADGKHKHRKGKKKGKEKVGQEDNRTEEEKLWDETILGVF